MMKLIKMKNNSRVIISIMLICLFIFTMVYPVYATNKTGATTVKVGYTNTPTFINKTGKNYSGYGVEYLDEISKYTNWKVEYKEANIYDQMQMLRNGQLDIVPLAQKTSEREAEFAFSSHPMGNTQCIIVVPKDSKEFFFDDFAAFDKKKIDVQKLSRKVALLQ